MNGSEKLLGSFEAKDFQGPALLLCYLFSVKMARQLWKQDYPIPTTVGH